MPKVEKSDKTLEGKTILVVRPVLYADRGIAAWMYDPWTGGVFTFKPYVLSETEISRVREQGKFISIGLHSTLESYQESDHPFQEMKERTRSLVQKMLNLRDRNDYHVEVPLVYFPF